MRDLFKYLAGFVKRGAPAAITGGGGKTSLLYGLGAELEKNGRVLLTVTTKLFRPGPSECRDVFIGPAPLCASFLRAMPERAKLAAAEKEEGGKLVGYTPEDVDALALCGAADFVIAECDGSRGRSLKFYESWEPPVPGGSSVVFAVMGADAFLAPVSDESVFRSAAFCGRYGARPGEKVPAPAVADYLLGADGTLKNAPAGADKVLVINKWELLGKEDAARACALCPCLLERYSAVCAASALRGELYSIWEV